MVNPGFLSRLRARSKAEYHPGPGDAGMAQRRRQVAARCWEAPRPTGTGTL